MFGDYFTQTLLASTRQTAMFGNLIVNSIETSLVNAGASLVIVMLAAADRADALLPAEHEYRSGAGGTMSASLSAERPSAWRRFDAWIRNPWAQARFLWVVRDRVRGLDDRAGRDRGLFSFNAGNAQTTWQGFSINRGTPGT